MFVSCVRCVLCTYRPLRRADHSVTGALPCVCVCVCVCLTVCNLENSNRGTLGPIWAVAPPKNFLLPLRFFYFKLNEKYQ